MTSASKESIGKSDVYVDEPWVLMRWDALNACVFSEWKGFANSVEFRAAVLKGVQAVRDHHATGYVTDTRKVRVIVHEDQRWANEVVAPMLIQAGLKRLGVVIADVGLGKMTVEETVRMADKSKLGLLVRTFHSVSEALQWAGER